MRLLSSWLFSYVNHHLMEREQSERKSLEELQKLNDSARNIELDQKRRVPTLLRTSALPSRVRFTVQVNTNTVMDNLTGLVWARNANLGGTMTWSNALAYCESLTYGGHSDWRLPNRLELHSLIAWQQPMCRQPVRR
jgi:hypothetical protein